VVRTCVVAVSEAAAVVSVCEFEFEFATSKIINVIVRDWCAKIFSIEVCF
jgi:hypothetical protein